MDYGVDVSGETSEYKTAMRVQTARGDSSGRIWSEVHRTLLPLKLGNMFVTVAILRGLADGTAGLAPAGRSAFAFDRRSTEVFDKKGNEIGVSALTERFVTHIDSSLEDLFRELRTAATEFGPQMDDQTTLLARYRG